MTISQNFLTKLLVRLGIVVLLFALLQQLTRLFWLTQTSVQTLKVPDIVTVSPLSTLRLRIPETPTKVNDTLISTNQTPAKGSWVLQGVYYEVDDPAESLAMISVKGSIHAFALGDELVSDVVITKILPERVDIDNRGMSQSLYLPKNTLQHVTDAIVASETINTAQEKSRAQFLDTAKGKEKVKGKSHFVNASKDIAKTLPKDLQRLLTNDPLQLLKYVRITPVSVTNEFDENVIGYELISLEKNVLMSVGLEENDVLLSLNQRSATPANLTQLLTDVKKGKKINAKISRNGKIMNIILNL